MENKPRPFAMVTDGDNSPRRRTMAAIFCYESRAISSSRIYAIYHCHADKLERVNRVHVRVRVTVPSSVFTCAFVTAIISACMRTGACDFTLPAGVSTFYELLGEALRDKSFFVISFPRLCQAPVQIKILRVPPTNGWQPANDTAVSFLWLPPNPQDAPYIFRYRISRSLPSFSDASYWQ